MLLAQASNLDFRDVNGLKKKKKEIHDDNEFENYGTLTSVSYCLSLLQTLLIAGCIIFLAFYKSG